MPPAPVARRRALIVGISGQDGSYLAELLLKKNYQVIGTSRDAQVTRFEGLHRLGIFDKVTVESMSPTDFRSVFEVLSKWAPQEVYNLGGQSSVALSFAQPVDAINSMLNATVTLLEAIRILKQPIRFYSAGSSECFGEVQGVASESTPFRPRSPYGTAKAAAHWMVTNYREGYGLFACSGILFNHESPLRPERFVTQKIVGAAARIAHGSNEKLVLGNLAVKRDWGWAPDYVDAMWRMLQREMPGDYVVATGKLSSLEDFIDATFKCVGLSWRDHTATDASLMRPTDLEGFAGDSSKARAELSWQPTLIMPDLAKSLMKDAMERIAT